MRYNIFVINNEEIAESIKEIYDLVNFEYSVEFLKNKSDFENVWGNPIDIVVLDSNDSKEIIQILNRFYSIKMYQYCPVILLTDIRTYLEIQMFDKLGFIDYLSKPANKFNLACRIIFNLNMRNSFRLKSGENRMLKSKLVEMEKIKIQNPAFSPNLQNYKNEIKLHHYSNEAVKNTFETIESLKSEMTNKGIASEGTDRDFFTLGESKTKSYQMVSILFSDFVGFTKICEILGAEKVVSELHKYYSVFDDLCEVNCIEKIKTIGDSYMCAGGLPVSNETNPVDTLILALQMIDYIEKENKIKEAEGEPLWNVRIGIHTGPIVAGVIGKKKFVYDIWGDAVNTASRMESNSEAGKINISEDTYVRVKEYFECVSRGKIVVKNKGEVGMYFVNGLKSKYCFNGNNRLPNKEFIIAMAKHCVI